LESGTDQPLNRLGISTFMYILNSLNSLRNQSDQTVLTPNRPSCLMPSPFSFDPNSHYYWIPLPFYSRLSTYLHTFDDLSSERVPGSSHCSTREPSSRWPRNSPTTSCSSCSRTAAWCQASCARPSIPAREPPAVRAQSAFRRARQELAAGQNPR
jgi:hypothetical protein